MIMRTLSSAAVPLILLASAFTAQRAHAQALPAGQPESLSQGFELPRVAGTLRYATSFNQSFTTGSNGTGGYTSAGISGNLGYVSKSDRHPFSAVASGGYQFATRGQESSLFENVALSQVFRLKRWSFVVSDNASYLPRSPIPSLSGLAGLGDIGIPPVQVGIDSGGAIQSGYAPQVSNSLSGSASRGLTGKTSIFGSGGLSNQYFLKGSLSGYDNHSMSASSGVNHSINALTQLSVNASYGRFDYPQFHQTTRTTGGTVSLSRRWSRALSSSFSGGPEYASTVGAPSSISFQGGASLAYSKARSNYALAFSRSVNAGSGLTTASRFNTLSFSGSRKISRYASAGASVAYSKTDTLPGAAIVRFSGSTLVGAVQASRSLSRTLSLYGSYTAQHQNAAQNATGINTLNGLRQTVSFGITYSPRAITVGRR